MKVLISGGGTGGHIFPALSIANALRRLYPDTEILFVGAQGRMEMERVPEAGYEIVGLPVAGFDRKRLWRNFKGLAKLFRSLRMARKVLRDFRPDICVGVGGYASGPMLKAAQKRGIPTLLQEQNSYAGVTNKLLAKKAGRICVAYDGMERFFPAGAIVKTGNPVRKNLLENSMTQSEAKISLSFDPEKPLLLVVGGSLGARTINESIAASINRFAAGGIQLLWQTGKNYASSDAVARASSIPGIKATPFISDMDVAYRAADLVVSRAGATILVPSPNVAEDHQRKNAMALVERQAAVMITDDRCRDMLADEVFALIADNDRRRMLADNISAMALRDSDEKIVDAIIDLISNRK